MTKSWHHSLSHPLQVHVASLKLKNVSVKKIEIFEMSPFVYLLLSLFANEKTKLFQTAMRRN